MGIVRRECLKLFGAVIVTAASNPLQAIIVINLEVSVNTISPKVISKKKRGPFFVLLYVVALAAIFSLPQAAEDFDITKFFIIFGFTGIIASGSNYWGARKFVDYADNHTVEITQEGLKSVEFDTLTTLPWDKITAVHCKIKHGKVSKMVLKTASSGSLDLSHYGNLDKLAIELKGFIDSVRWK
jgi:hypothetical protein